MIDNLGFGALFISLGIAVPAIFGQIMRNKFDEKLVILRERKFEELVSFALREIEHIQKVKEEKGNTERAILDFTKTISDKWEDYMEDVEKVEYLLDLRNWSFYLLTFGGIAIFICDYLSWSTSSQGLEGFATLLVWTAAIFGLFVMFRFIQMTFRLDKELLRSTMGAGD